MYSKKSCTGFAENGFLVKSLIAFASIFLSLIISSAAFAAGQYMWPVPGHTVINGCSSKGKLALDINSPTPIAYAEVVATKSGTVLMTYTGCHNYNARETYVSCSSATCSPNGNIDQDYVVNGHTIYVCNYGSGNGVVLKHDDGTYSRYSHLMDTSQYPVAVSVGQHVEQGQLLGYVGQTGNADGFHLHFEISSGVSHSGKYYNTTPLIDAKTVEYIYEDPTPSSVLDVNGELNGGIYSGGIEGMGTFDVYINNSQVADDVADFWKEIPQGANYTITDIKSTNPSEYAYTGESSYSGTIGESDTNVYLHFVTPQQLDVNGKWDVVELGDTGDACTFDVYINNNLVANDVNDYCANHNYGSTYAINDIRWLNPAGYQYAGEQSYSGTLYNDTKVVLPFSVIHQYVDLNALLDGGDRGGLEGIATADIYLNGELVGDDVSDYCYPQPYGTEYLANDIKLLSDEYVYEGPASFSGTVANERVDIRPIFKTAVRMELPANTEIIQSEAFMNVPAAVIVLPNQATTIEARAFANCPNLVRIVIPENVTSIASNAFEGCDGFTIIGAIGSYAETFAVENNISFAELRGK